MARTKQAIRQLPENIAPIQIVADYYSTGTASRSGTTITGVGTTWTTAMKGMIFLFADQTTCIITGFTDATHLTSNISGTVASQNYNIKIPQIYLDGNGRVAFGSATVPSEAKAFLYGGVNGANFDIRSSNGNGEVDQAVVEVQGSDFETSFKSTYMAHYGPNGTGTTLGITNTNLGAVVFQGDVGVIGNALNVPLIFGQNNVEKMRLSAGNLGIGTGATVSAKLHVISTTEQARIGYDASNYYKTTVSSAGAVTFDAVGSGSAFTFSDAVSVPSIATSAASPFLLTNGQLITIGLTSQTVGGATLTIPNFANVSDTFAFLTLSQTFSNKTFIAPVLGTPLSGNLANCTALPIATGISGLGSGIAAFLAVPSCANLATAITDETGSGSLVFGTSPTLSGASLGSTSIASTQAPNDNSTKLATTAYVDNAILGQNFKEAVKYASTAALPSIVYANGSSGVGATLTGVALAAISLDGNSPSVGDRVLIKNQASTFQNGIYTVTQTGSGIAVFILTRAVDADQTNEWKTGDSVFVTSGSTLSTTSWAATGIDSPVMGTDPITFAQTAGQGSFTSGNGITISGVSIAIDTSITVDKTTAQVLTNKDLSSGTNTFPTLNQNTTGSAAKWTTARNLAGNSVDGSANVAFANKFIVQGTADAGLSAAQFLGSLSTGILKNTTSTGVLSIAVAADFPTLNQNTTGSAATLTTARTIGGVSFDGSANITVSTATAGFTVSGGLLSGTRAGLPFDITNSTDSASNQIMKVSGTNATRAANDLIYASYFLANSSGTQKEFVRHTIKATTVTNTSEVGNYIISVMSAGVLTDILTVSNNGLSIGTANIFTTGTIEIGHASDSSIARVAAATISVEGETLNGCTTTATAAGTTTLTITATKYQLFTGSTTQTVKLPTTSVVFGQEYVFTNTSTGLLTVQSSGGNQICTLGLNQSATFRATQATPTTAAHWLYRIVNVNANTNGKRLLTVTQSATPSMNTNNGDIMQMTGLAQAITSLTTNLTGSPVAGDMIELQITDNGTARAITPGASFGSSTVAFPTTTVASTMLRILCQYDTLWRCIAVA